jgi:hypothetical protein
VLARDVYSRPPITIKSHDLHVGNIRKVVGEITFTTRRTSYFPPLVLAGNASFGLFLAFLFVFYVMVIAIVFYCVPFFLFSDIITIPNENQDANFIQLTKVYKIVRSIKA